MLLLGLHARCERGSKVSVLLGLVQESRKSDLLLHPLWHLISCRVRFRPLLAARARSIRLRPRGRRRQALWLCIQPRRATRKLRTHDLRRVQGLGRQRRCLHTGLLPPGYDSLDLRQVAIDASPDRLYLILFHGSCWTLLLLLWTSDHLLALLIFHFNGHIFQRGKHHFPTWLKLIARLQVPIWVENTLAFAAAVLCRHPEVRSLLAELLIVVLQIGGVPKVRRLDGLLLRL